MKKVILVGLTIAEVYGGGLIAKEPSYLDTNATTVAPKVDKFDFSNDIKAAIPYFGVVNYDGSSSASAKERSLVGGIYANIGTLDYLLEFNYNYLITSYKDSTVDDLKQHDVTLLYNKYYEKFMLKGGVHTISTNDTSLGDGVVVVAGLGGYQYQNYDKYSYGIEGYYSYYKDGHDESYVAKSISLTQLTPYFSYFKSIDLYRQNSIDFKMNYIIANGYETDSYTSYEISDTYYYHKAFVTAKVYWGEMRTGVKDGGLTTYNTLDLVKNGYSLKIGYYLKPNLMVNATYSSDTYTEYGATEDGTNNATFFSLSYKF